MESWRPLLTGPLADRALAEASRRWFERALDFQDSAPGFLEGIAGIGLAFLGGLSDFEPASDRVLALSAASAQPPRR